MSCRFFSPCKRLTPVAPWSATSMTSPFLIYLFHLSALTALCGRRVPYVRLYAGTVVSFLGICATVDRYSVPDPVVSWALDFMMAFLLIDFIFPTDNPGITALQRIAGLLVCRALQNVPDRMHVPSLGLYAVSQTYYVLGAVAPTLFVKWIYVGLHGLFGLGLPLWYLVATPMTTYTCGIHMLMLTQASYELGRAVSWS